MMRFLKFYALLFILILLGCSTNSPQTRDTPSISKASDIVYRVQATYLSMDMTNEYQVSKNKHISIFATGYLIVTTDDISFLTKGKSLFQLPFSDLISIDNIDKNWAISLNTISGVKYIMQITEDNFKDKNLFEKIKKFILSKISL